MSNHRTPDSTIHEVLRLHALGKNRGQIKSLLGLDFTTISKITSGHLKPREAAPNSAKPQQPATTRIETAPRLPEPAASAGGPSLPEPTKLEFNAVNVQETGTWGVLSDVHIPYHDKPTIEAFVKECKSMNVVGILLNGDILDCYQLSDHMRDPTAPRIREEVLKGREFLAWLRDQFPRVRMIYKEGNHDDRIKRYLAERAPDIYDLEDVWIPNLLRVADIGCEWVADKRVVMLGKLPVIHGHEYQGGGGVMPARWLYLRTGNSVLAGHFHHPTYYPFRTITQQEIGCWSTGCACFLSPAYRPLNQWANGFALVEIFQGGTYHVHNRRLLKSGQIG